MREYDYDIATFKIVTASQGKFEVRIDGETVFSKLETGRFPSNEEIKETIKGPSAGGGNSFPVRV